MAWAFTSHTNNIDAVAGMRNQIIANGGTINSGLSAQGTLYSLAQNLAANLPVKVTKYTASINVASVASQTSAEQTFTVTGLTTTTDFVFVNKPTASAGLGIVNARVSAADEVGITFMNATTQAIDPATETYTFVAFRF